MKISTPHELRIHGIREMLPHTDGSKIVVLADGDLQDARTEIEIAVTTDLAPSIALALLATTAKARSVRDGLEPALDVLGAGVVRSSSPQRARLQLLFAQGQVLPLELSLDACQALSDGLVEYLSSAERRLAS